MDDDKLPEMITIHQAACETGLPDYLLRKLCITRQVGSIKSGKKYYMNKEGLSNYLRGDQTYGQQEYI